MAVNPNADSLGQVHRHGTARTVTRSNGSVGRADTNAGPSTFMEPLSMAGLTQDFRAENTKRRSARHALISASTVAAASHKARLVTAPH